MPADAGIFLFIKYSPQRHIEHRDFFAANDAKNAKFRRSGFSREHQWIVFTNILLSQTVSKNYAL